MFQSPSHVDGITGSSHPRPVSVPSRRDISPGRTTYNNQASETAALFRVLRGPPVQAVPFQKPIECLPDPRRRAGGRVAATSVDSFDSFGSITLGLLCCFLASASSSFAFLAFAFLRGLRDDLDTAKAMMSKRTAIVTPSATPCGKSAALPVFAVKLLAERWSPYQEPFQSHFVPIRRQDAGHQSWV